MPRTMSREDHEKFDKCIMQKRNELKDRTNAIRFLSDVGYCVENGKIVPAHLTKEK